MKLKTFLFFQIFGLIALLFAVKEAAGTTKNAGIDQAPKNAVLMPGKIDNAPRNYNEAIIVESGEEFVRPEKQLLFPQLTMQTTAQRPGTFTTREFARKRT